MKIGRPAASTTLVVCTKSSAQRNLYASFAPSTSRIRLGDREDQPGATSVDTVPPTVAPSAPRQPPVDQRARRLRQGQRKHALKCLDHLERAVAAALRDQQQQDDLLNPPAREIRDPP